jgi:hypothetical protein
MDLDYVGGFIDGDPARPVDAVHASGSRRRVSAGFHDDVVRGMGLHRDRVVQNMDIQLARVATRRGRNHGAPIAFLRGGKTAHDDGCAHQGEYGFHDWVPLFSAAGLPA